MTEVMKEEDGGRKNIGLGVEPSEKLKKKYDFPITEKRTLKIRAILYNWKTTGSDTII